MNRTYRLFIRSVIYLSLAFYCIAVSLINGENVFSKRIELNLGLSCIVPLVGVIIGAIDLMTYRRREKERVLRTGKPTTGRIEKVSYPFASSKIRPETTSIFKVSTPLGGKEPLVCHTLYISYIYEGKKYVQESRMRSGVCGLKKGDLVDIWVDHENPKSFYLYA